MDNKNSIDEKNTITITTESGEEKVCDILFTFDNEETHKSYVAYTDNTKDENGRVRVYASIYDPNDLTKKLEDIKTDREWKVIQTIIETLQEEVAGSQANN